MSDSEESAAVLLERRRSYIISNRIVVNSQRVAFGQPKTSKVGGQRSCLIPRFIKSHLRLYEH